MLIFFKDIFNKYKMRRDDYGIIDLRGEDDEAEFKIGHVEKADEPLPQSVGAAGEPHDKVRVKFDKFVNLISTHAYEEIFDKHQDEDVIVSTNLLTDLANAQEEKSDKKLPFIFLIGILIGIGVAWFLLK